MEENQNQTMDQNQVEQNEGFKLPQTQEELNLLIQRESDRRVTNALKKNEEKLAAKYDEIIESEKREAVRLAKLTAAEREAEKFKKEKEQFESERQQFKVQQLEMEVTKQLNAEGLPIIFAKNLMANSAEEIINNIKEFKEVWQQEIQKAVQGRLVKSKVPGVKTVENTEVTKEQFMKMSFPERNELYLKNKELYNSLIK